MPCLFLWIFTPIEAYYLLHSKTRDVPWSWINISKFGVTFAIIIVLAADLATIFQATFSETIVYDVEFYTPVIKAVTIVSSFLKFLKMLSVAV